jgi:hypothetical protein
LIACTHNGLWKTGDLKVIKWLDNVLRKRYASPDITEERRIFRETLDRLTEENISLRRRIKSSKETASDYYAQLYALENKFNSLQELLVKMGGEIE